MEYKATPQNFQDLINSDLPVLVDFSATWCGPCRALAPTIEAVASEYDGKAVVVKCDVDECEDAAMQYGIRLSETFPRPKSPSAWILCFSLFTQLQPIAMKKILAAATLLAALLLGTEVSAQHYNYTRFGIVGGVTSSESKIKDFNSKSITQYHAGLLVEIPLGAGFGFQTGALYQVKGMQLDKMNDSSISDIGNSFETKVGFIEVPLQLQWGPDLVRFREVLLEFRRDLQVRYYGLRHRQGCHKQRQQLQRIRSLARLFLLTG